ncbi:MAG: DNA cytosine methyltransferase, partial [Clostridia bacterium]|nr:DNA cytosine methyltransferase [Clostridia bacterium]
MNKRSISFFSGAMGLDLGLIQAGIEIEIGQDFDNACVHTMQANGHRCISGDIRNINAQDVLQQINMKSGEAFLVCGGPPCQPFSTAGKRLGINDPRGSLFKEFVRMIDEIRPRFFIMENVKGLMSTALKDDKGNSTGTRVLDVVLEEFGKLNYKTVFGVLDAVNYGVPQFRERFVMIGSRDNESIFLPAPTHFRIHQNPSYRWLTLGDAIKDLENSNSECTAFSESRLEFLRMVPEGGNWKDIPPELLKRAMGGAYLSGGGKVGFYR